LFGLAYRHARRLVGNASVGEALRALPTRQRDAVVLRSFVDRSEADVAHMLGVAPGNSRLEKPSHASATVGTSVAFTLRAVPPGQLHRRFFRRLRHRLVRRRGGRTAMTAGICTERPSDASASFTVHVAASP
jgi:hypothetical protein